MSDIPNNTNINIGLNGGGIPDNLRFFLRSDNGQTINIDCGLFVGIDWQIICWSFNWTTFTAKLIIGGVTYSATNLLMDSFVLTNLASQYVISSYNDLPSYYWEGSLGEFVEYSGIKSDADINQLGNYFATKYGLVWVNI